MNSDVANLFYITLLGMSLIMVGYALGYSASKCEDVQALVELPLTSKVKLYTFPAQELIEQ